jgi:hypothetical protein
MQRNRAILSSSLMKRFPQNANTALQIFHRSAVIRLESNMTHDPRDRCQMGLSSAASACLAALRCRRGLRA